MTRASKNCPARRLDLSDDRWKERIYTMLSFCVASHIALIAVTVASVFR
jgi:hypothetical protein